MEAVPNRYNPLYARYIHFTLLGSGGSRTSLGDPAGLAACLAAWLAWLPGCLAAWLAWLPGWPWLFGCGHLGAPPAPVVGPRAPELNFEAVPNRYNPLYARYIHFTLLGSGGSRTSLGDPAGLAACLAAGLAWLAWLPGWPGCLAGLAAWPDRLLGNSARNLIFQNEFPPRTLLALGFWLVGQAAHVQLDL